MGNGDDTGGASGDARTALDFAYAQIGKPGVWGGTGPDGYDCSGLTMRAWGSANVALPRTIHAQAESGVRVSRDELRPGDLVFFYDDLSHMGIYAGNGRMVHVFGNGGAVELASLAGYWDGRLRFGVRP